LRSLSLWRTQPSRLLARLHPHWRPLALVVLGCAIGQVAVLSQRPVVALWSDTPSYLAVAQRILAGTHFTDPVRTPGYPALLALVFLLTGGEHFGAVVAVQTVLLCATAVEGYVLTCQLQPHRGVAAAVGACMGINILIVNWERMIMTEALSCWVMVTLFLVLERYLRHGRAVTLLWVALLCAIAFLIRPIFIYLPALVMPLLAIHAWRIGALALRWRSLAGALILVGALLLAYMGANAATTGYFGLSAVSNVNLFGKVIEFNLYDRPLRGEGTRYARLQTEVAAYVRTRGKEPWTFVLEHPHYAANGATFLGGFALEEIRQHPLVYLRGSARDLFDGVYAAPYVYAPYTYRPAWIFALWELCVIASRLYIFFPLLLLASMVLAWRHLQDPARALLCALLLAVAGDILVSTLTDYTEFWRLRVPLDWALTVAVAVLLPQAVKSVAAALATLRGRLAVAIGESARPAAHRTVPSDDRS
jgi:hypothetical protein